jgi:hypothetical protein
VQNGNKDQPKLDVMQHKWRFTASTRDYSDNNLDEKYENHEKYEGP